MRHICFRSRNCVRRSPNRGKTGRPALLPSSKFLAHRRSIYPTLTTGYDPQANGSAKRSIGLIKALSSRCSSTSGFDNEFWSCAVRYVVTRLNPLFARHYNDNRDHHLLGRRSLLKLLDMDSSSFRPEGFGVADCCFGITCLIRGHSFFALLTMSLRR